MFIKFPSIESFHQIRKDALSARNPFQGTFYYRAKVKLHGTNAGVTILPSGQVLAQKRTGNVTIDKDNMGFAMWVAKHEKFWEQFAVEDHAVTVFGEWAGPGIQKSVAISAIPEKIFAVFGIQIGETFWVEPDYIKYALSPYTDAPSNMYVLPWYEEAGTLKINFFNTTSEDVEPINKWVDDVENCDPFVKEFFGVEGIGEGLVFYPFFEQYEVGLSHSMPMEMFERFAFKAKGEKHAVKGGTKAVQIAPEKMTENNEFVNMFFNDNRCEQGVQEACEGEYDVRRMGKLIEWMNKDILKESRSELAESGLEWKQLSRLIGNKTRFWYMAKCSELPAKEAA